jgi:hypothetical protein
MATAVTLDLSQMSWLRGWAARYSHGEAPTLCKPEISGAPISTLFGLPAGTIFSRF